MLADSQTSELPFTVVQAARSSAKPATVRAEIFVSENGGPEILERVVDIPSEAVDEAMMYLKKRPALEACVLLRVFVAHWRIGVNLNRPAWLAAKAA